MKFDTIPGETCFHALVRMHVGETPQKVWFLTPGFFTSLEDVVKDFPEEKFEVRFPVEVNDNGTVYIPDKSELE